MINKSTISYLVFGVLTTAVNIVVYTFLVTFFNMDYKLATTIAWILSVLFAFITNKLYVFNSKDLSISLMMKEFANFVFFRLLSLVIDIIIMVIIIDVLKGNDILAKFIANGVVIVMNYFTSKYVTFKKKSID
jgi:putative flippase GtrA